MLRKENPVTQEEFLNAAQFGKFDIINRFIEENRDNSEALNAQNPAGCTALQFVIDGSSRVNNGDQWRASVNALLAAGADVNLRSYTLTSPLLAAVCSGNLDVLADLLAVPGLDLNPMAYHETPLLRAAKAGNAAAVEMLLNAGAYIEDTDERQYISDFYNDHALSQKHNDIICLLENKNENNRRRAFLQSMQQTLSQDDAKKYYAMSSNKFLWFKRLVLSLHANNHLDHESIAAALLRVTNKPQAFNESAMDEDKNSGEVPLHRVSYYTINDLTYMKKLQLLISGFSGLNKLHENQLCHGDIGAHSFSFKLETLELRLIHCASTCKVHSASKHHMRDRSTPGFFNGSQLQSTRTTAHDVLMMEEIISSRIFISFHSSSSTSVPDHAIELLKAAMKEPRAELRCTSEQAQSYCELLLEEGDNLTREKLNEIAIATINRDTSTIEDVLRECTRATQFRK